MALARWFTTYTQRICDRRRAPSEAALVRLPRSLRQCEQARRRVFRAAVPTGESSRRTERPETGICELIGLASLVSLNWEAVLTGLGAARVTLFSPRPWLSGQICPDSHSPYRISARLEVVSAILVCLRSHWPNGQRKTRDAFPV